MDVCTQALTYARNRFLRYTMVIGMLLCVSTLILTVAAIKLRVHRRVALHANVKIIFANTIFICCTYSLANIIGLGRFLIAYWTYDDPCDLPASVGFVAIALTPCYFYFMAYPMCHLVATLERLCATVRDTKYEKSGSSFGVYAVVFVWLISMSNVVQQTGHSLEGKQLSDKTPFWYIMADTPDDIGHVTTFVLIALDLLTSVADIVLIFLNRSKLKCLKREYSLSQSYQVSENLRVTTGLVLPLGLCNAVLYIGFLIGVSVLNHLYLELPPDIFQGGFAAVGLLTLLQAPLSLMITIFFCMRRKRFRAIADSSELTELYFGQFQKQIDSNSHRAW